ncbi:hypothetical protein ARMSODRAFT_584779 [Armillaria solidipes]|uniref:Uncharacterized protein n=1 Tax=Armillaria solidipes TaxID=1076256 RepID=A0A2H3BU21_9AGAR|nr:hypothetical protein ARMSODRAFT_584779 [Armillaria solidipes]
MKWNVRLVYKRMNSKNATIVFRGRTYIVTPIFVTPPFASVPPSSSLLFPLLSLAFYLPFQSTHVDLVIFGFVLSVAFSTRTRFHYSTYAVSVEIEDNTSIVW